MCISLSHKFLSILTFSLFKKSNKLIEILRTTEKAEYSASLRYSTHFYIYFGHFKYKIPQNLCCRDNISLTGHCLPVARKTTKVHITLLIIFHISIHLISKL